jgi:hypothetical protein
MQFDMSVIPISGVLWVSEKLLTLCNNSMVSTAAVLTEAFVGI